jgi:hypothetical protein
MPALADGENARIVKKQNAAASASRKAVAQFEKSAVSS